MSVEIQRPAVIDRRYSPVLRFEFALSAESVVLAGRKCLQKAAKKTKNAFVAFVYFCGKDCFHSKRLTFALLIVVYEFGPRSVQFNLCAYLLDLCILLFRMCHDSLDLFL